MQLKYVNAAANLHDIQVPSVQVEPMQHGHTYEVEKALGLLLLERDPKHWKEVLPKEDKVAVRKNKVAAKVVQPVPSGQWLQPLDAAERDSDALDAWDEDDFDEEYSYTPPQDDDTRKDGN